MYVSLLSEINSIIIIIITITNNVLAHIFEDFRSYEFSPLLHNHW